MDDQEKIRKLATFMGWSLVHIDHITDTEIKPRFLYLDRYILEKRFRGLLAVGDDLEWDRWGYGNFIKELPMKWVLSTYVKVDNEVVGYAICSQKARHICHIHRFMIKKGFRNEGLGTNLLASVTQTARAIGLHTVTLKVPNENKRARNFYRTNGFAELQFKAEHAYLTKEI